MRQQRLVTKEITIKKILAAVAALTMSTAALAATTSPAQAHPTIPGSYSSPGWWDQPSTTETLPESTKYGAWRYTYPDFPINCFTETGPTSDRAIKIVHVYSDQSTSMLNNTPTRKALREQFRRASSVFGASAERTFNTLSQANQNRSLRFETQAPNADGVCHVDLETSVAIPVEKFPGSTNESKGAFFNHMAAQGFNQSNRKYLYVLQVPSNAASGAEGGAAYNDDTRDEPGVNNWHNVTSTPLYVKIPESKFNENGIDPSDASAIAHETAHSLGALMASAPNVSANNPSHSQQAGDLLSGSVNNPRYDCGTQWQSNWGKSIHDYRLDCQGDDYYNAAPASGSYLDTHWNVADSSFLWGNAQP